MSRSGTVLRSRLIPMFEIVVDFHDSTSPRKRRFENYSDAAQFLEQVPTSLGYLGTQKATVEIQTISNNGPTLFDLP